MFRTSVLLVFFFLFSKPSVAHVVFGFDNESTAPGTGLNETGGGFTLAGLKISVATMNGEFKAIQDYFGINQAAAVADGFGFYERGGQGVSEGFTFTLN